MSRTGQRTAMNIIPTAIPEVLIIEPKVFGDSRGFFFEAFNAREFARQTGVNVQFVQDNHSRSIKGVLRGLHYQVENTQGKLVRVVQGKSVILPWTCARARQPSANGSRCSCRPTIIASYGFPPASPMALR